MKNSARTFTAISTGLLLWLCLFSPSQQALADNASVSIGRDTTLAADKQSDNVVSVFGSSTSEGEVTENIVSVFGDTRVSGPVGENAVAVLGDTYVNSAVKGNVVAVLGDVELGPLADVGGDLVSVGGTVIRDPAAQSHGQVENVSIGHLNIKGVRTWISHCLILGRPLAFAPGLGWAWGLAGVALALYLLLAALFPKPMDRCVRTFSEQPGHSALTALIAILLTPVIATLLVVTVVGILAIPFVWLSLWIACLFGKAVMLAWIGRRFVRASEEPAGHPALAVLIGGIVVALLSVVPVLGFLVFMLLGFLGLGAVLYTLILERRASRAARPTPPRASKPGVTVITPPPAAAQPMASVQPTVSEAAPDAAMPAADSVGTAEAAVDAAAAEATASAAAARGEPHVATATAPFSTDLQLAGFWIRMAALAIDLLLVGVLVHLTVGDHDFGHRSFLILVAAYGAVMWKLRGTTVGGIVCKLKVRRVDGHELNWENSIVRALACFLSLAVAGLGFIWIAFDDQKQSWHDKIAGTVVVQTERQESLVRPAA